MRFLFICLTLIIAGCATSPTGRKQLMLTSDSTINSQSIAAFEEMKTKTPIEHDAAINAYVHCVVEPITKIASTKIDVPTWEIVVFKSDEINAFAMPGGKIGVYTGIFKTAQSPAQLAAVLGHEVGHVIARHGAERFSQEMLAQGLMLGAGLATQENENAKYIMLAASGVTQFGYLLPHSRTQESEADLIGMNLMAQAGFNPDEAILLWQHMQKAAANGAPEFISDHPSDEHRISALKAHLADAKQVYAAAANKPTCVKP